ncbi:ABC transporter permease, partial [Candidatus Saccharibacteria bacterium]|nr:ABC transporter permease [candidate division Zixibacteria bacterium]NIT03414.1 ABC transporter permease [Candidatus Saccharibacteria bacterium]
MEKGQLDPARYLLTSEEIDAIEEICQKNPDVLLVTPLLRISGLVTNGKVSTIFVGQGIVPSAVDVFLQRSALAKTEE